jgi:hypothetical protein
VVASGAAFFSAFVVTRDYYDRKRASKPLIECDVVRGNAGVLRAGIRITNNWPYGTSVRTLRVVRPSCALITDQIELIDPSQPWRGQRFCAPDKAEISLSLSLGGADAYGDKAKQRVGKIEFAISVPQDRKSSQIVTELAFMPYGANLKSVHCRQILQVPPNPIAQR